MSEDLELRAAVATEVMGFAVEPFNGTLVRKEPVDGYDFTVDHYETEIAAAWTVVEAMRARGLQVEVICAPDGFGVVVTKNPGEYDEVGISDADSDTAPEAICKAALAAARSEG